VGERGLPGVAPGYTAIAKGNQSSPEGKILNIRAPEGADRPPTTGAQPLWEVVEGGGVRGGCLELHQDTPLLRREIKVRPKARY
jgi:hypothetical protein